MSQFTKLGSSGGSGNQLSVQTDSGTATSIGDVLNFNGDTNLSTTGAGNNILISLTGIATHAPLVGSLVGGISSVGPLTSGQVLIGSTGNDPVPALLTAGTNVTITTGPGTITINSTGGGSVSPLTTKGDIYTFSNVNDRLPVGTDTFVLSADSTTVTGLKWVAASAGSAGTITGDSGGALGQTAGNWNLLGSGSIATSGAVSTMTFALTGLTNHALLVGAGTSTITKVGPSATTGQILQNNAAADPSYSTATYPSVATGAGTILRADGTNWLASTSTYPNTNAINTLLYASAANVMSALSTGLDGVLITSHTGVPSWLAAGTTGQVLTATTGAPPSWAAPATNGTVTNVTGTANQVAVATGTTTPVISLIGPYTPATYTAHGVLIGEGTSSIVALGAGSAGQVLQSGGAAADPLYSTATYPSIATATGTILRADGTNWVATTATYPTTTTINQILYSSAANVIGEITGAIDGVLITSHTGVPSLLAAGTTGQYLKATTGAPASWATIALDDLSDVVISTPIVDQILKYNGATWLNAAAPGASAGPGITFFNSTPVFNSVNTPGGLSQDGTTGNGIVVDSLSITPVTSVVLTPITMTSANPGVVSFTSHGLPENGPVVFTTTGALPTNIVSGTTYFISQTGYTANSFQVSATVGGASIDTTAGVQSGTHTLTAGEQTVTGQANTNTVAFAAWLYNTALGRTLIDAGEWQFETYCGVNTTIALRVTTLTRQIYQVAPVSSGSVTTTNLGANTKTATITSGQFTGTYFAASATNTVGSYLQTPSGIYLISAVASVNSVTIVVPTGYVNESAVTFNLWNKLFFVTTPTITDISPNYGLYTFLTAQPAYTIALTDKLGAISYATSNNTTTLTLSYNGSSRNSHFTSSLAPLHNQLGGLQGGSADQYYHLTSTEYTGTGTGVFVRKDGATLTGNLDLPATTSINLTGILTGTGATDLTASTVTQYGVLVGGAANAVGSTAVGSAGQVLQSSGAGVNPVYSTATFPATATGTGKVLIANGTNWVASTPTFPNASATAGKFIQSDGTNWIASTPTLPTTAGTAGKVLMSNATNYVESTPTYPSTSGGSGVILRSDGTNNVYTTATYPTTTTINQILYSSATNTISEITTAIDGVLITSHTGVPSVLANSGTAGWVLTANTGAPPSWQAGGAGASPLTTKGDIFTYSTVNDRLPVGTNTQILSADSTTTTGLKWIAAPAGSAGTITGDSGGALSQSAGNWNILGTANQITTTGSGATLTLSLPSAITTPGSLITTTTLKSTTLFTAAAGQVVNRTATAVSANAAATDYIIAVTDTTAARTITLLSAPTTNQVFIIKDESGAASINNISIVVSGGAITIDGLTTQKINTNYGAVACYFNGTSYFLI